MKKILSFTVLSICSVIGTAQSTPSKRSSAPIVSMVLRERTNATQWFAATPTAETYGHQDSMLRLGLSQRIHNFDYLVELGQTTELALPSDAVSLIAAQGQLGLGGTYYAANSSNRYPVAASLRQGFLRYHLKSDSASAVRIGRFEFFEGQETTPRDATMLWLQTNRVGQRLVGNFGFSNGQRSFDGIDLKLSGKSWDMTAMAGRPTQGVFNMNANPELNVDLQYAAYSRGFASGHILVRGFAVGYHDGRTGLTKTDNRSAATRAQDHRNIRIGTYGGDLLATTHMGKAMFDLLLWGAGQNGTWGVQGHSAGAVAVEGGLKIEGIATKPWLRGGYWRSTGDNNPVDGAHNTFFQVLPTPRIYARYPFFNLMNSKDAFLQVIDKPTQKLELRTDLHFLQLTAPSDLWYQGGGAFDNKVFGYTGRPGNSSGSFSSFYDVSADIALTKQVALAGYFARAFGKTVIASTYPSQRNSNYGYFELTYRLQKLI